MSQFFHLKMFDLGLAASLSRGVFGQLVSSFQLLYMNSVVEKSDLSGPGLAKAPGYFCREVVQESCSVRLLKAVGLWLQKRHLEACINQFMRFFCGFISFSLFPLLAMPVAYGGSLTRDQI